MSDPKNPYAPPVAPVGDGDPLGGPSELGRFVPYGRTLAAGRGAAWIGDAWRLLRAQPGMWAAALILMLVAYIVLSLIPLVNIFVQFVGPFAYAGLALAADEQRRTGNFELRSLLGGFERHTVPLLIVGVATFLAGILFLVVLAMFLGTDILGTMTGGFKPEPSTVMTLRFWLAVMIGLALMLPVICATYLAPQLIVLHDQPALIAMKMSLAGTVKNVLAGLVFGLCALGMLIVSMIPLMLGLLITVPILAITNYTVYRDIFVDSDS
jgi:uncharacterized membrane protein